MGYSSMRRFSQSTENIIRHFFTPSVLKTYTHFFLSPRTTVRRINEKAIKNYARDRPQRAIRQDQSRNSAMQLI